MGIASNFFNLKISNKVFCSETRDNELGKNIVEKGEIIENEGKKD